MDISDKSFFQIILEQIQVTDRLLENYVTSATTVRDHAPEAVAHLKLQELRDAIQKLLERVNAILQRK